jgi:hypothetical protein
LGGFLIKEANAGNPREKVSLFAQKRERRTSAMADGVGAAKEDLLNN